MPSQANPVVDFLRRNPVLASLVLIEAPTIGGLIASYAAAAPTTVQVILTVLAPLVAVVLVAARAAVTPVVDPKLDENTPLVPKRTGQIKRPRR